jgi:hypothetical protein
MRKLVLLILILLSPTVFASRPIMEDEVLACVNDGTPAKVGEMHTISFSNGYEMDVLRPGTLMSMAVLKSPRAYSATFKVNGLTIQKIDFDFKDYPDSNACFTYDNSKEYWSISRTPRDMCYACSLKRRGN